MIGGVTIWEIIWTGGLPHLNGLPHLPGVPHLHVKQALSLHSTTRNLVVLSCIQDEPLRRHFHMATITFSMLKNKMRDFSWR